MLFGIVDLHAITTPSHPATLRPAFSTASLSVACGLDPEKSHQFAQSRHRSYGIGLGLTCLTPIGNNE